MRDIVKKGLLAFAATALACLGLVSTASANPSSVVERVIVSELHQMGSISVDFKHIRTVQKDKVLIGTGGEYAFGLWQARGSDKYLLSGGKLSDVETTSAKNTVDHSVKLGTIVTDIPPWSCPTNVTITADIFKHSSGVDG